MAAVAGAGKRIIRFAASPARLSHRALCRWQQPCQWQQPRQWSRRLAPTGLGLCRLSAQASQAKPPTSDVGGDAKGEGPFSDATKTVEPVVESVPPFIVRVGLVGASAGVLTPLFATGGLIGAWYKYKPNTVQGAFLKYGSILAVGGSSYTFIFRSLIPFMTHHGELILPFALSNALSASICYGILEKYFGLQFVAGTLDAKRYPWLTSQLSNFGVRHLPVAGSIVGVSAAALSVVFWPAMIQLCWPPELQAAVLGNNNQLSWLGDLYFMLFLPVGLPIGIFAGIGIHQLLVSTVSGSTGSPWQGRAGVIFISIILASILYFKICSTSVSDLYWEVRVDPSDGKLYSYNIRTDEKRKGASKADDSALYRTTIFMLSKIDMGGLYAWLFQGTNDNRRSLEDTVPPVFWRDFKEREITMAGLGAHMSFSLLVDRMLRLKKLQIRSEEEGVSIQEFPGFREMLSDVDAIHGVSLESLLHEAEAGIVAKRKQRNGEYDSKQFQKERASILARLKKRAVKDGEGIPKGLTFSEASSMKLFGVKAAETIMRNLDVVESRMRNELGYEVPDILLEKSRQIRTTESRTEMLQAAALYGGLVAGLGLIVARGTY
eukprot:CAMPEP_0114522194 /NCGR_PEP_ID=MMETSP0109-20121206/20613_1 /TAXON_ID=29199 /ORGANISM="Chlorarachnion reptans, Strain CCCM449" /LENGTH=604 /DNA_ID=CAMNT_0001703397 /DNA_START=211 /DNA_END=2025 /DNA_ORIENTATION=+